MDQIRVVFIFFFLDPFLCVCLNIYVCEKEKDREIQRKGGDWDPFLNVCKRPYAATVTHRHLEV